MKLEKDYAIIETADEAACFGGREYNGYVTIDGTRTDALITEHCTVLGDTVSRAEVLEAITAKDGDAVFWWGRWALTFANESPEYEIKAIQLRQYIERIVKVNAITIGKTIGELRELLAWAKGEA